MAERADPFHKVLYVLEGAVAYREKGREERRGADKGAVLLVPAGTRHSIRDERPATLLVLGLGTGFVEADEDLGLLWRGLRRKGGDGLRVGPSERRKLEGCWRRAMLEARAERPGSACALKALAGEVLVALARTEAGTIGGGGGAERVAAVAREVENSFPEPWSLDEAAARAGMSRRRFSALHREVLGASFLERLTELRVAHAARLLERREATVLGAMFASGFNDLSHFYRVFRERRGMPPGRWGSGGGDAQP